MSIAIMHVRNLVILESKVASKHIFDTTCISYSYVKYWEQCFGFVENRIFMASLTAKGEI